MGIQRYVVVNEYQCTKSFIIVQKLVKNQK